MKRNLWRKGGFMLCLLGLFALCAAALTANAEVTQTRTEGIEAFPESYRPYLETLQKDHPTWQFVAFDTGLTWDEVLDGETAVVRNNLVRLSTPTSWKSLAPGSFDWETNTFATFDGGRYNGASREIVAYYMDPRNSLDQLRYLFQFEQLTFDPKTQTEEGVKLILKSTFMKDDTLLPGFTSPEEEGAMTYAQAFMAIAAELNVSPYHLAARVRQEQGSAGTSSLISGTYPGYEGYYNYFNISASGSTTAAIIENGLKKAKNEGWNTAYKALLGGSRIIADQYIAKGQDTLYLEKFDVAATGGLYSHQYMQNLTAAYTESVSVYNSYDSMGLLEGSFTFVIPVYRNMPETACPQPTADGNPNYKLQSLGVSDAVLDPVFHRDTQTYTAVVGNKVHTVTVSALAYAESAKITGAGEIGLAVGENVIPITVTAERGDTCTYTLRVTRLSDGEQIIAMGTLNTGVNLRTGPSLEHEILVTVPAGRTVSILAEENGWYQVIYGQYTGYMSAEYVNAFVPAKGLTLSTDKLEVIVGNPGTLQAVTDPNPCDTPVLWKTSDPAIATVEGGVVTGITTGTVTITAYTENGLSATCTVTVKETVLFMGTVNVKSSSSLNVRAQPSTSSTALGKLYRGDRVTVVEYRPGWCRILYQDGTGWVNGDYVLADPVPSTGVTLSPTTGHISPSETLRLEAVMTPIYANDELTWTSSNPAVAVVEGGVVTALHTGKTVITVTTASGHSATCTITVKEGATSIALDRESAALEKGQTLTLNVTLLPEGVVDLLEWKSDNAAVVTVKNGVVTAVGNGTATVTVTTSSGKTATCKITVTTPAAGVKLDQSAVSVPMGGTLKLTATMTPSDTTDGLTWSSSDPAVVTVENGLLTGIAKGSATVTVTTSSGKTATCTVTVIIPATGVKLDKETLSLLKGGTAALTATVTPADSTDVLTWSSSNTAVVTVKDGVVTAVGGGTATVTVTTTSGKTATCTVTVTVPATGIALKQETLTLPKGGTVTLTATMTPADSTDALTWSSNNTAVATVKNGVVTAVGKGSATITVKTASGKTATCTVTVTVPATVVKLDKEMLTLPKGSTAALTATVTPADSTDVLIWSSSNTAVATVKDGVVTAVSKGSATITVTASSGKTATCTVTVTIPATGVKLDKETLSLVKGGTATLTATMTPADSNDALTWSSSNTAVATVKNGVVTAVGKGSATITVKTASGKTATCTVTVNVPATGVKLDKETLTLAKGSTATLKATLTPTDSTDALIWSSSNTAVATVKDGVVTAVGKGSATITVKTASGKTATCTVTVTVPATGVKLDKTEITLIIGESTKVSATLTPADTTDGITWSSSDSKVFTVKDGTVTAVAPGTATLTVTARDGVKATCTIRVKSPVPDSVTSSVFTVKDGYIRKIPLGTTVSQLLAGLQEKEYCKVYLGDKEAAAEAVACTGMVVKLLDGNAVKASYTLVVTGDADGDGMVTVNDYVAIKGHILKKAPLSGAFAEAADADGDGSITVNDYVEVKAHILKKNSITAK